MLEVKNFLDVQLVLASAAILGDLVDQHGDFRYWRVHPVQQTEFERQRDLLEALRPIGLNLTIFNLLGACDDRRQPLAFNRGRYPNRSLLAWLPWQHPEKSGGLVQSDRSAHAFFAQSIIFFSRFSISCCLQSFSLMTSFTIRKPSDFA